MDMNTDRPERSLADMEADLLEVPGSLSTWAPIGESTYDPQLREQDLSARRELREAFDDVEAWIEYDEGACDRFRELLEAFLERYDTLYQLADMLASQSVPMRLGA